MIRLIFPSHHRSPHQLSQLVSGWHGIPLSDIASGVVGHAAAARQDLVLILTEFTGLTPEQIGIALGGRSTAGVSALLRDAKRAETIHQETRLRLVSLRAAALALPGDIGVLPDDSTTVAQIARSAVAYGAGGAFERLALAVIGAVEVLREPKISDQEARHAAFCLLSRPGSAPTANVIPMKGTA